MAIFEVRFTSGLSEELIPGVIKCALEEFEYKPPKQIHQRWGGNTTNVTTFRSDVGLFVKNGFKVKYLPGHHGSLNFNMIDHYPGWATYFSLIKEVLEKVEKAGVINNFQRLGLRYISIHPVKDVFKHITGTFSLEVNQQSLDKRNTIIRIEDDAEDFHRVIQIGNQTKYDSDSKQTQTKGIFDIDIHCDCKDHGITESLLMKIDDMHMLQKKTYFGLLHAAYLEKLEPQYK